MSPAASSIWVSSPQQRVDLLIEGKNVADQARQLHSFIRERAGPEAADLFAEPQRSAKNGRGWRDRAGATQTSALSDLPPSQRESVAATLRARLAAVEPLQADPRYGSLVSAALVVDNEKAIRAAGERPIIAGWGGIPPGLATSEDMRQHHEHTLGPYLTQTDPPVPGVDGRGAASAAPGAGPAQPGWRAALIATFAAAAVLLVLVIPGVLVAVQSPATVLPPPAAANADAANRALEEEIRLRERQLSGDVCATENEAVPRIEPQATPPRPPVADPPARRAGLTPPVRPDRTPVPSEAAPAQTERPETLAKLINAATVLVLTKDRFGTGFFVSPQLILTNRHVVEDDGGTLLVANRRLGQLHPAEQIALSESSQPGGPDYALLKLKNGESSVFLSLWDDVPEQLQNVIAAGYPRLVLNTDANFERLRQGDSRAIPDTALTNGTVVVVQNRDTPTPVILHRASISPGNSGGPLVDECGRVVGINTFVAAPEGAADRMNYSLGVTSATAFLKRNNVSPTVVGGRCVVPSQQAVVTPGQQPGQPGQGGGGAPEAVTPPGQRPGQAGQGDAGAPPAGETPRAPDGGRPPGDKQ